MVVTKGTWSFDQQNSQESVLPSRKSESLPGKILGGSPMSLADNKRAITLLHHFVDLTMIPFSSLYGGL